MNLLLFIIAFLLVAIFTPFGIVFTIIKSILYFNSGILKSYFFRLAISLDQFGNVVMTGFFNLVMISKESKFKFGNPDETISSVLGKNKLNNSLIWFGKLLDKILNKLEENHSIKSIEK